MLGSAIQQVDVDVAMLTDEQLTVLLAMRHQEIGRVRALLEQLEAQIIPVGLEIQRRAQAAQR